MGSSIKYHCCLHAEQKMSEVKIIIIIIIGANELQEQLVTKAKTLGYETHVFAWEKGATAKALADYFYPISITDKETILREALKLRPVGVTSIASDLAVPTVSFLCEKLGLTGNSQHSALIATNKFLMRQQFQKYNIPSPGYLLADEKTNTSSLDLNFPLIVKPPDRSGSRPSRQSCSSWQN